MKKTKNKILDVAHRLFNAHGVAKVTPRQIATASGISHGNLNYHFRTKQDIIRGLHERLLHAAQVENIRLLEEGVNLVSLMNSMRYGFQTLYEYRFFMIDLNHIVSDDPELHTHFKEVEKLRHQMYASAFEDAIFNGWMRPKVFEDEYDRLILRIRVFSDFWIASAAIYDQEKNTDEIITIYHQLFMDMFYPYLTEKGKLAYQQLRD